MTALPHEMRARTVADRSSKCAAPSRCQSAAHTRVASCVATSSWVPGLFSRRSLRCWWGCGVVMEGGRGRPAAASGGGVKVQVWRRWGQRNAQCHAVRWHRGERGWWFEYVRRVGAWVGLLPVDGPARRVVMWHLSSSARDLPARLTRRPRARGAPVNGYSRDGAARVLPAPPWAALWLVARGRCRRRVGGGGGWPPTPVFALHATCWHRPGVG